MCRAWRYWQNEMVQRVSFVFWKFIADKLFWLVDSLLFCLSIHHLGPNSPAFFLAHPHHPPGPACESKERPFWAHDVTDWPRGRGEGPGWTNCTASIQLPRDTPNDSDLKTGRPVTTQDCTFVVGVYLAFQEHDISTEVVKGNICLKPLMFSV